MEGSSEVVLLLALVSCVLVQTRADLKAWRFDTDWSNGANWRGGRVPGCGDAAALGAFGGATVALPSGGAGETCARALLIGEGVELLLPRDGALRVGVDAAVTAPDAPAASSSGAVEFVSGARDWLDPDAWTREASMSAAADADAVPHSERVPCWWEGARLPKGSFGARLPLLPLRLMALWVGRRWLAPDDWRQLRDSPAGQAMLPLPGDAVATVEVHEQGCADASGCTCHGANTDAVIEAVCDIVSTCPLVPCTAPVRPQGHCCSICGATLQLHVRAPFRMSALRAALRRSLAAEEAAEALSAHASRQADGRVQVVLVERGRFAGRSEDAALRLKTLLLADPSLHVASVTLKLPGTPLAEVDSTIFVVVGTLIANCVLFGGLFFVFSKIRSLSTYEPNSFSFARFENADAESDAIEVEVGSSAFTDLPDEEEKSNDGAKPDEEEESSE